MKRTFDEHELRVTVTLDGFWSFAKDPDGTGDREQWHTHFPDSTETMAVPGCWDTKPQHFDYRGVAWYRREFHIEQRTHVLLTFEGVSGIAEVYLDGVKVCKHNGSYTSFEGLKRSLAPGRHQLIVKVDNTPYPGKVMPDCADWHLYGGIHRSVEMALLDRVWIKKMRLGYMITNGVVSLQPVVTIKNLTRQTIEDELRFSLNGNAVAVFSLRLEPGEEVTRAFSVGEFELALWSPATPALHAVRVSYAGDDLIERTGFRTITFTKSHALINGEPMKLLGVNRHHDYGDCGFAMSPALTLRDFEIIRDMGCNAVRSHYPIDRYAMDICDELGLLYWAEIPLYARWDHVMGQKPYVALAEQCLQEMIERDINHPSIFAWSILNECATSIPEGVKVVKQLTAQARALDPSRPVTYASNRILTDLGYPHLDIIGINAYPGWYDATDKKPANWSAILEALGAKLEREGLADVPVLITETGAGAIYGDRSLEENRKWSENTQADILDQILNDVLTNDAVAGIFIWQFCDIRTETRNWERRPGCFNNKGLLDRYRRPKLGYRIVKERFQQAKSANNLKNIKGENQ